MGARLLAETYAKEAAEQEKALIQGFRLYCNLYYSIDSHGRFYRTEQDEVIELTSEEKLKDRYSSCVNYINDFMGVCNAKRNLTFKVKRVVISGLRKIKRFKI